MTHCKITCSICNCNRAFLSAIRAKVLKGEYIFKCIHNIGIYYRIEKNNVVTNLKSPCEVKRASI